MWWIIGLLIIAWGIYAVVISVIKTRKDPSVGGAAMIAVMLGSVAILVGSLLTWMLY